MATAYLSRYEAHNLRRRSYAITKIAEDEPTRYLVSEEPPTWTTLRQKALRFDEKTTPLRIVRELRGGAATGPYRVVAMPVRA